MLASRQQTDQAIGEYMKVVERKPTASVLTMVGILQDSKGNAREAEANYRKALELSPDSPIAANNLAWLIVENQGNLDEALGLATTAVSRNQNIAGFYDTLGWVYLKKGLNSPAVEQFRKAIAIDEKQGGHANAAYRVRLAMALEKVGDRQTAKREASESLRAPQELSQAEAAEARRVVAAL